MRLKHATTAQDELSEALASSFVQGSSADSSATEGKDVDEFVKEFKELRKTYHKRVIWGDRWSSGQVSWASRVRELEFIREVSYVYCASSFILRSILLPKSTVFDILTFSQ